MDLSENREDWETVDVAVFLAFLDELFVDIVMHRY
jgi:hypothetical protein